MDQKVDWAERVDVLQGTFAEHTVQRVHRQRWRAMVWTSWGEWGIGVFLKAGTAIEIFKIHRDLRCIRQDLISKIRIKVYIHNGTNTFPRSGSIFPLIQVASSAVVIASNLHQKWLALIVPHGVFLYIICWDFLENRLGRSSDRLPRLSVRPSSCSAIPTWQQSHVT